MKISDELQAQIDFLKKETTTWVRHAPDVKNQSCAIIRWEPEQDASCHLSTNTVIFLQSYLASQRYSYASFAGTWNDRVAENREEVISVLKEARDQAIAAGE